jgi:hypothetical protein
MMSRKMQPREKTSDFWGSGREGWKGIVYIDSVLKDAADVGEMRTG